MDLGQGHQLVSSSQDSTCCHTQKYIDQILDLQERSLVGCFIQSITYVVLIKKKFIIIHIKNILQQTHQSPNNIIIANSTPNHQIIFQPFSKNLGLFFYPS